MVISISLRFKPQVKYNNTPTAISLFIVITQGLDLDNTTKTTHYWPTIQPNDSQNGTKFLNDVHAVVCLSTQPPWTTAVIPLSCVKTFEWQFKVWQDMLLYNCVAFRTYFLYVFFYSTFLSLFLCPSMIKLWIFDVLIQFICRVLFCHCSGAALQGNVNSNI